LGYLGTLDSSRSSFSGFSYIQTPRITWISNWKILGADFGAEVRIPIEYKKSTYSFLTGQGVNASKLNNVSEICGLTDMEIQPVLLAWHLNQFDVSMGYSFWAPTGDYNSSQFYFDNLGQGYWTHSFMLGGTWYPDSEKSWSISILNHFDINTEQHKTLIYPQLGPPSTKIDSISDNSTLGDIYTLEGAISKTIKNVDFGLTGYFQQQVTDTKDPTFLGPTFGKERIHVAGIGPEIGLSLPNSQWFVSLRYAYEFSAMDHPQGNLITLAIKKSF
jgi:hypothetical protein